ncbi:unnamed protein product [Mytilus coruscus]|uniref:Uncharacterized protein n=1 Tax=Mytilus coruscus TaxID=42192 RepID=A0A6J8E7M2_MYTCO|nr:unnamed protein product [Mytilus coruscus]
MRQQCFKKNGNEKECKTERHKYAENNSNNNLSIQIFFVFCSTSTGFIDQKILTYMFMAVAGALLVIIGLCLCLVCVCWKRHVSSKKKKKIAALSSAVPLTQFPIIQENGSVSEITNGYEYEVIDDTKLEREIPVIQVIDDTKLEREIPVIQVIDDTKLEREIPVIQHDYISVESSNNNSEVCGTDSDGYLHPYHSLVSVNSISSNGVDDKNNENIYEEKSYLELSVEQECKNEVQQNENCELVNNETVGKKEDEIMYDVPKNTKSSGDKVIFM